MTKELLGKAEIKFWLVVIGMVVSFTVCFTELKTKVYSIEQDQVKLQQTYEIALKEINGKLETITRTLIEQGKDIESINKLLDNR
jgi:uncharacterized membrane protein YgaE (UPF0421/DUF939 family)